MTLVQLKAKLEAYLEYLATLPPGSLTTEYLTLSTLGDMLGTEFWLLLMYQMPAEAQTSERIATALERIEKKMMPSY